MCAIGLVMMVKHHSIILTLNWCNINFRGLANIRPIVTSTYLDYPKSSILTTIGVIGCKIIKQI